MKISTTTYMDFPAWCVEWLDYQLIVTPSVGGRILGYSYKDVPLFYAMEALRGRTFPLHLQPGESIRQLRNRLGMKLYGGFKVWLSPQHLWGDSPYIDLDLGSYVWDINIRENRFCMNVKSPVCRETGIQLHYQIIVREQSPNVIVGMGMKNCGVLPRTFGIWDVTQVNGPCTVSFPIQRGDRLDSLTHWEFNEPAAVGKWLSLDDHIVSVSCRQQLPFKIGTGYSEGWIWADIPSKYGTLRYQKSFPIVDGTQCGHGCAIEVYDSGQFPYCEVEVHAPLVTLQPDEESRFLETWSLHVIDPASDGRP